VSTVKTIQSVRRATEVVAAIAAHQPVGVSELSRLTTIDKSAVHRLVVTLHGTGWLEPTGDGRWRIAPSLPELLRPAGHDSLVGRARPVLDDVRDRTGETTMLVVIDHGRLVVLALSDSHHNLRITAPAGSELPLRNSSALRAIAANLPPTEVDELRRLDPSLDDRLLAEVRRRGWALNDREIVPEAVVVGAAVTDGGGRPLAAIIVALPSTRADDATIERTGATLREAVRGLSPAALPNP
jgi:IclR family acetate operon transcriptional repressor